MADTTLEERCADFIESLGYGMSRNGPSVTALLAFAREERARALEEAAEDLYATDVNPLSRGVWLRARAAAERGGSDGR